MIKRLSILLTLVIVCFCTKRIITNNTVYNGNAITTDVEFNITELLKKGSILNGNDIPKNIAFLKTNLANIYKGNWNIIITTTQHLYQNMNYSLNGQWWLHWYGKNPYHNNWIYGMQRVAQIYDPVDQLMSIIHCENKFGSGFSLYEKMFILNSFGIDHSVQELNKILNENITKGNWNILRNDRYQALFHVSIYAKSNKWFSYCTFDSLYFVYLS